MLDLPLGTCNSVRIMEPLFRIVGITHADGG